MWYIVWIRTHAHSTHPAHTNTHTDISPYVRTWRWLPVIFHSCVRFNETLIPILTLPHTLPLKLSLHDDVCVAIYIFFKCSDNEVSPSRVGPHKHSQASMHAHTDTHRHTNNDLIKCWSEAVQTNTSQGVFIQACDLDLFYANPHYIVVVDSFFGSIYSVLTVCTSSPFLSCIALFSCRCRSLAVLLHFHRLYFSSSHGSLIFSMWFQMVSG